MPPKSHVALDRATQHVGRRLQVNEAGFHKKKIEPMITS